MAYPQTTVDILAEAEIILGPAVKIERGRPWATWWCPFHPDAEKRGESKDPNFGINIEDGYWKCLRCGASGPSLAALKRKLGTWRPPPPSPIPTHRPDERGPEISDLGEAFAECRGALLSSPAMEFIKGRGLKPGTAMIYGLGYGQPHPPVSRATLSAAYNSRLILPGKERTWLWAGSVVYVDPPTSGQEAVINVRYIPDDKLPPDTRPFTPKDKHHTWGRRTQPLGVWRATPATKRVLLVEGMFDMLIGAQTLHALGLFPETVAAYTNGSSPARAMLDWISRHTEYEYLLIPDSDDAGDDWLDKLILVILEAGGRFDVARTPDGLDPDEAFLKGWWPDGW